MAKNGQNQLKPVNITNVDYLNTKSKTKLLEKNFRNSNIAKNRIFQFLKKKFDFFPNGLKIGFPTNFTILYSNLQKKIEVL
jgi:hypothetical protein